MGSKDETSMNGTGFIIGALIGGMAGAAAALLYAPKSGREIRGEINQSASQLKKSADNWKDIAYERGSSLKELAYDKTSGAKEKAMDLTKNVSQKTQDLTKSVQNKLQTERSKEDEALQAAAEVADAIEQAADELEKGKA